MAQERVERRLAAILAADVVGYSRLMGADEAGTLARLKALRKELVQPQIVERKGRVVKLMGDGLLAEFPSVVQAVECAVAIQQAVAQREPGVSEGRRIRLRIGVNLGDIIVEGSDIYGNGVNVAARLEGLAEPGGLCISGPAFDTIEGKLDLAFVDIGPQQVKNFAKPVRAYRLTPAGARNAPLEELQGGLVVPNKPSIAVLPFTNMSGDPEQEYFSDGLTEDIITELSRFRNLLVVARNSSFTFKGLAVDVKEIGRKLGSRYVVEGSVRRAGNRIRITAQLLETATGNHLWAERYDREMEDIFAVQDELVRAISGVIPGQLDRYAVENLRRTPPDNLTAYDSELRGRWALAHWSEGPAVAREWFEKAVKADPGYALAHAGIAMAYSYGLYVLGLPPESSLARAMEHAQQATALDDRNPVVHAFAAFTYLFSGEYQLTRRHAARAVSLNPNDPFALYVQACALSYTGDPEQALEWFAKSERLEPYAPDDQRLDILCDCYYMLGEYEKVIEIHGVYQYVPASGYQVLAAAYAQAGASEKARAVVEEYQRRRPPEHDPTTMIKYQVHMCSRQVDRDRWLEGYRKAGFNV